MLEGNGAKLVALAERVQRALERLYRLDPLAEIGDFISVTEPGERETLLVREGEPGVFEIQVRLPPLEASLDSMCQVIEGVSHFVYVADRARADRQATQLELELQAEVDKWVVLAASMGATPDLRARLYEDVRFEHDAESERGERYRVANASAHKFVRSLERLSGRHALQDALRRFFHGSQEEKLRLAQSGA